MGVGRDAGLASRRRPLRRRGDPARPLPDGLLWVSVQCTWNQTAEQNQVSCPPSPMARKEKRRQKSQAEESAISAHFPSGLLTLFLLLNRSLPGRLRFPLPSLEPCAPAPDVCWGHKHLSREAPLPGGWLSLERASLQDTAGTEPPSCEFPTALRSACLSLQKGLSHRTRNTLCWEISRWGEATDNNQVHVNLLGAAGRPALARGLTHSHPLRWG